MAGITTPTCINPHALSENNVKKPRSQEVLPWVFLRALRVFVVKYFKLRKIPQLGVANYRFAVKFTRHPLLNFIVTACFLIKPTYNGFLNACDCLISVVKHHLTGLFVIRII